VVKLASMVLEEIQELTVCPDLLARRDL